eukprot:SAG22_NODE_195_length_15606_cov_21.340878_1_plen_121_part_10
MRTEWGGFCQGRKIAMHQAQKGRGGAKKPKRVLRKECYRCVSYVGTCTLFKIGGPRGALRLRPAAAGAGPSTVAPALLAAARHTQAGSAPAFEGQRLDEAARAGTSRAAQAGAVVAAGGGG